MGELERDLIQERLRRLTPEQRRFRINAGQGWTGDIIKHSGDVLILRNSRVFHAAPVGWSDLVGIDSIVIRREDVPAEGLRVAVFAAEEFKTPNVRLTEDQRLFGKMVTGLGGRFEVMR